MGNPGSGTGRPASRQGALVGGLVVLALLVPFGWPWLSAWWRFPAPPADAFRAALLAEAAELRWITAHDAAGQARTVPAGALTGVAPGPCTRWYRPDDARRSGSRGVMPFAAGMAEFTCIADLRADDHGPLRAVVVLTLRTRPEAGSVPRANLLPDGPYARQVLDELEARR